MARVSDQKTIFTCQQCGYQSPKWLGKCPECTQWNSLIEERFDPKPHLQQKRSVVGAMVATARPQKLSEVGTQQVLRSATGIGELDRVLGGGLVEGSVVLVGGEPGIGKSTLMLQVSSIISKSRKILYISGEESVSQMKLRAERLGVSPEELYLVNETNLNTIIEQIKELKPYLVVIDSIQIVYDSALPQSPGTVTQIRESAGTLTALAKTLGISVFIIGHITKEGVIAGPKILEHIVDSVVYFEGERRSSFRILRAIKNRFGPVDEIGIFSMGSEGLEEVKDASSIFISRKEKPSPGTSIMAAIEGTRPILVEVQALVSASSFGMARQRSMGFDFNRMILLIAVLEKNMGLNLSNHDAFLNIVGGVRVAEPASDLAASLAIISSFRDESIRQDTVVVGEVGLTSEVRSVTQLQARINEAHRIGFRRCIVPESNIAGLKTKPPIELIGAATVEEAWSAGKSETGTKRGRAQRGHP